MYRRQYFGGDQTARWELMGPRYGFTTECGELYLTLRELTVGFAGKSTLLDMPDGFCDEGDFNYCFGKGMRDICVGNNEMCIFEIGKDFGSA